MFDSIKEEEICKMQQRFIGCWALWELWLPTEFAQLLEL